VTGSLSHSFKEGIVVKGVVEVHSCYCIELGEPRPIPCACRKIVSTAKANELVKLGGAEWVIGYDRSKPYHDGRKICLTGRMNQTPRAATIDDVHIERAYVDGYQEEKSRIEEYGKLNYDELAYLFVNVSAADFRKQEDADWGIPVLQFTENNRTLGGINREER
jgi:hypothetical protein